MSANHCRATRPYVCFAIVSALLGTLALLSTTASAGTPTIWVGPPNGTDDTTALQTALNDCMTNYPTGCTIQLSVGTYYTMQLTATNFHGAIAGRGMDVTVIAALTPFPSVLTLLRFIDSDIAISDMSLKVTAYQPVVPCDPSDGNFCGLRALVGVYGTTASASIRRVSFEGGPGPDWGFGAYNLYGGLLFGTGLDSNGQGTKGNLQVSDSRFKNSSENLRAYGSTDSHVTIGGSGAAGNTFENAVISVAVFDSVRSVVDVSHNTASACGTGACLFILQGQDVQHDPAQFLVQHNTVKAAGDFATGILVADTTHLLPGAKASQIVISNNDVVTSPNSYDGIQSDVTEGLVVSNNRVSGSGIFAIDTNGDTQCLLHGNNVQNFNPDFVDIGLMAPTSDCTVVGGSTKDNVYDEGTNDTIVGINNMRGNPPGPAIKQAMQTKQALLKLARH